MEALNTTELSTVVQESGIEKSKGELISKTLGSFFEKANEWNDTIQTLQIKDVTETGKMKMAREARLTLKNQRIECKKLVTEKRNEVKAKMADFQLEDKLWLKSFQMVEATFKNLESKLEEKEKFAERKEAERLDKIEKDRIDQLLPYQEFCQIHSLDLRKMDNEMFNAELSKAKRLFDLDKAEKERLEKERIAKEKAESEERERIRKENERLKKEAEEKERAEQEKIAKEKDERDAWLKRIEDRGSILTEKYGFKKQGYDFVLKDVWSVYPEQLGNFTEGEFTEYQKDIESAIERKKKADAKLKKEREEKARIEAELKKKKDAEEAENRRIQAEKQAKEEADRKAALAPQKQKITNWVNSFSIPEINESGMDIEAVNKILEIDAKFKAFKKWAVNETKSIK